MPTLAHYLFVSGLLFAVGLVGVLLRRNLLIVFMCLELMLSAANLSLVAFSRFDINTPDIPNYHGQILVFFIITVAAAEVAVGLAILVALFKVKQTVHVEDLDQMKL
jgi:NADH-quinone oxidoreductase subunit K